LVSTVSRLFSLLSESAAAASSSFGFDQYPSVVDHVLLGSA
jgi:hypothetical protein